MTCEICPRCGAPIYQSEEIAAVCDAMPHEGPFAEIDPWLEGRMHTGQRCAYFSTERDEKRCLVRIRRAARGADVAVLAIAAVTFVLNVASVIVWGAVWPTVVGSAGGAFLIVRAVVNYRRGVPL